MDDNSLTRDSVVTLIFLTLTPLTLILSLFSFWVFTKPKAPRTIAAATMPIVGVQIYASLPSEPPQVSAEVIGEDARIEIVNQYLEKYDSPLTPYASFIVDKADEYKIDFRLITAIAQQESNLCKWIPEGSHNCWGWGIHSEGTLGFGSYKEGIEIVTRGIKQNYIDEGLITPEEIMSKYTPLSNGSWAEGVNTFLNEML